MIFPPLLESANNINNNKNIRLILIYNLDFNFRTRFWFGFQFVNNEKNVIYIWENVGE